MIKIFDISVSVEELNEKITSIYKIPASIVSYTEESHIVKPLYRLGKLNLLLESSGKRLNLSLLVKECSSVELSLTSLMNIILPYSSPKVVYYQEKLMYHLGCWMFLENISTWVDLDGSNRIYENLLDGIYEIHKQFFDKDKLLIDTFPTLFRSVTWSFMKSIIENALFEISTLSIHPSLVELFPTWEKLQLKLEKRLPEQISFISTLVHNNYYPNSVRGMYDSRQNVRVVAYDWINSIVGWPQLDLVVLLDRIDVLTNAQLIQSPSDLLLERYLRRLRHDAINVSNEEFIKVYNLCYLYKVLPLIVILLKHFLRVENRNLKELKNELEPKISKLALISAG